MFQSVGPGELFTIGIVALIVFGPHRLPDMARRIGGYMRELRAAAADIRQGLDAEVRQLKDPIESVTKDLTKPVTEVKDTLAQTADVVKKSTDSTTEAVNKSLDEARTAGKVEWVGPAPKTGVKPDEAWDGTKTTFLVYLGRPGLRQYWEGRRGFFHEDFVHFVDNSTPPEMKSGAEMSRLSGDPNVST